MDGLACYAVDGDVCVLVFNIQEWTLPMVEQLYRDTGALGAPTPHSLIHHMGADPGPAARRQLVERQRELERRNPFEGDRRIAVVTDSTVTRAVMTAWRWLTNSNMDGFRVEDAQAAAAWVAGDEALGRRVHRSFRGCLTRMKPKSVAPAPERMRP